MKQTFQISSPYDGLALHGILYLPTETPKGIVQLVHGMEEHKNRYEDFMQFLADNGYVALCHDHRGHGESVADAKDLGWFGDKTGNAVVEDVVAVTKYVKNLYPDLPDHLFGHSMGSLIVRCCVQEQDTLYAKLVVCGSPSQNPLAGVAIALEKIVCLFRGERHRSKLLAYLSTGAGAKRFQGEGKLAWLSANPTNVAAYEQDEKCGFGFTCNGYENLFKLLKRAYQKKKYRVENPTMPVRFIAGADDPVIVSEKKWRAAVEFFREIGYKEVSGKLYKGMRHEILNEEEKGIVYQEVLAFIEGKSF